MITLPGTFRSRLLVISAGMLACGSLAASEVLHWNQVAMDAARPVFVLDPLTESRVLAIVHVAMHDAANAIEPRYQTYRPDPVRVTDASVDAAVAASAHAALSALLPQARATLDIELENRLRAIPTGSARTRGIEAGREAARRMLEARRDDGADAAVEREPGKRPGEYRPTPPDFTSARFVHWGAIRPFVLRTAAQFRPARSPAPDSAQSRAEIAEVAALGGTTSSVRTHEQSEIACFWYEHSTRGWNRVAREVGILRGLDTWDLARMLALVHLAMADGFIGGFEAKYHYNFWRPATAIRATGDAGWLSYLPTPPVPDYPSTHTVLGAAAATAIARCLGTDYAEFAFTSGEPYAGITRRFWSLSAAARENGASRVFAGLHFPTAVEAGYVQGYEIGDWVAANALRPVGETPSGMSVTSVSRSAP